MNKAIELLEIERAINSRIDEYTEYLDDGTYDGEECERTLAVLNGLLDDVDWIRRGNCFGTR